MSRHGSTSAPGGGGEPGHGAGMGRRGALEGSDGGWSFRDSAGVCGGVKEEQVIFNQPIFFSPKTLNAHREMIKTKRLTQILKTMLVNDIKMTFLLLK